MIHAGQLKSGPWLLSASGVYASHDDPAVWGELGPQEREDDKQDTPITASRWYSADVEVRPDAIPPGHRSQPSRFSPRSAPEAQVPDDPWVKADWRNGNGGAFHSDVRPPMSSDIPHPHDILDPDNPRQRAVLDRISQGEDPVHDPWNVLGGSGQSFENLVQNQMGHHLGASPEQNYEGRVWYRAAHEGTKDLSDKTIGDHPKTVAIMSALSPKTEWDENVEKGHHFLTHYRGDPNDPNFILPGMQGPVDKAKAIWHDAEGAHKQILSGPKTQAFSSNILDPSKMRESRPGEHDDAGYYQHPVNPHTGEPDWRMQPDQDATMDTHHVRATNTVPGSSLGGMKYGTPDYFNRRVSVNGQKFDPSYDLHARANWEATRRLNAMQADPERHITPKQAQAVTWTKFKHDVDTDPDKKKHLQPPPGVQPKSMGPLTNPIPRYQKERDPEWWDDPRRPKVDLRQTPNWYRRPAHIANTANNGSIWGKMLGDYIGRNPQEPTPQNVTPIRRPRLKPRRPNAPRREHNPRKSSVDRWYTAADADHTTDDEVGKKKDSPQNPADIPSSPNSGLTGDVGAPLPMAVSPGGGGGSYGGGGGNYGPAVSVPLNGGGMNAAQAWLNANQGNAYDYGGHSNGSYDCSGGQSELYNYLTGKQPGTRNFDTTAFANPSRAQALGFQPGYDPNSIYNIGVNTAPGMSGHMAGEFNGKNFEVGGAADKFQYGGSATGPLDPQFSTHYHLPNSMIVGYQPSMPSATPPATPKTSKWYKQADPLGAGGMPSGGIGGYNDSAPFAGTFHNQYTEGTGGAWAMAHPAGVGGGGGIAAHPGGGGVGGGATPSGSPTGGPPSQSLTEALQRAGIPAEMHPLISGFSKAEGNNPAGVPTLGFTDMQAGGSLDQHAQALAKQLSDRQSVSGPFPSGASPQDQAAWMATVVGQQGLSSDWQGNAQPSRSDYVNRVVNGMPNSTTTPPPGNG